MKQAPRDQRPQMRLAAKEAEPPKVSWDQGVIDWLFRAAEEARAKQPKEEAHWMRRRGRGIWCLRGGLHPTKGYGSASRRGKRSNRTS